MTDATNFLLRWRFIATSIVCLLSVQLFLWGFDRQPPFKLLGWAVTQPAYPGGTVELILRVERDMYKECSVIVSRFISDGQGFRTYLPTQEMTWEALQALERNTPGYAKVSTRVPDNARPGSGVFGTLLRYECNPTQRLWPLYMTLEFPFIISEKPQ